MSKNELIIKDKKDQEEIDLKVETTLANVVSGNIIDNLQENELKVKFENIDAFQKLVKKYMKSGMDYMTIPGVQKEFLTKAGAEKLCVLFGVSPRYTIIDKIQIFEEGKQFFEWTFKCNLIHNETGNIIGEGIGSCNTGEKQNGQAHPMDIRNSVLKKAKKRALVDSTLGMSSIAGVFSQDLDETMDPKNKIMSDIQKRAQYSRLYAQAGRILKRQMNKTEKDKDAVKAIWNSFLLEKHNVIFMSDPVGESDVKKYIVEFVELLEISAEKGEIK